MLPTATDNLFPRLADSDSPAIAAPGPLGEADLSRLLTAWHEATDRLQQTHESLQGEVRRLTNELEQKNAELARKNRLADLGQMASHVAHEVRNGLVPITLYLSLLGRSLQDEGCRSILDKLKAGFTALEVTVNDLLQFTSDRDPQWSQFDVGKLIHEVCEGLAPQMVAQGVSQSLDIPAGLQMHADESMMRRVILNLVLNAIDIMPQGGELAITAWSDAQGVEIEVADSGPGLADEVRTKLFEPFFSTKADGTGLGLTIVERIAAAHHGWVRADNCAQGGAAITIRIPRRAYEAAA